MNAEKEFQPKGLQIKEFPHLYFAISQLMLRPNIIPRLSYSLKELQKLRKDYPGLTMESFPLRLMNAPSSEDKNMICGIHGPLERNFRSAFMETIAGLSKNRMERIINAGVLIGIGTQEGPFSLFYRGPEIAGTMGVYYNLHPNVLGTMSDQNIRRLIQKVGIVSLENGWFAKDFSLSHNPDEIADFKEHYETLVTLDTSHLIQSAKAQGIAESKLYLHLRSFLEKTKPEIVHISNRKNGQDGHPISQGDYTEVLRDFIWEIQQAGRPILVVLEVEHIKNHEQGVKGIIQECYNALISRHEE